MTFKDLRQHAIHDYYPALFLEMVISRSVWNGLHTLATILASSGFVASVVLLTIRSIGPDSGRLHNTAMLVFGGTCFAIVFYIKVFLIRAFYNSYHFADFVDKKYSTEQPFVSYELARVLYRSSDTDITRGICKGTTGKLLFKRMGITEDERNIFFSTRRIPLVDDTLLLPNSKHIGFAEYMGCIYDHDKQLSDFLFSHGIQRADFIAVCEWHYERLSSARRAQQWWSSEHLARIPSLGKTWTYGQTFELDKYAISLPEASHNTDEVHSTYGTAELQEIETILTRRDGANVMLVSDDRSGLLQIIARLQSLVLEGVALPDLEGKRVVLFDPELLVTRSHNKQNFEAELLKVFNDAQAGGNVILVVADMPAFIHSAESFSTDISSLLESYFSSSGLHVIGLSDMEHFHNTLERNTALMQHFDRILVEQIDPLNTLRVLQNEIIPFENAGLFFTYQSLQSLVESAERYFPDAIMPDRAVSLLTEVASKNIANNKGLVEKADIESVVEIKTGIPVGAVKQEEKDKLLNLESFLHHRIIGQDEAVEAISNAVRRARSGINNPNRPLASFLFLGPTGVGKTETTKALAETFFGSDTKIERLDMSEYSGADALEKLIGTFENTKPGVLSSMLREHPYGVLLLDEFEKTIPEVMNLFLQILDEGFFSDMSGKKVNARNLLIIATSNAGSDLIWESVKHGDNLSHARDLIIDAIVKARIFKPELINRFDGVIIFHPLATEQLSKIATLQLEKLKSRLGERGINLSVTPDLVNYVVRFGSDPKFGARPMNRAIQDKVEQVIAEKMIRGDIRPGSTVELTAEDLPA